MSKSEESESDLKLKIKFKPGICSHQATEFSEIVSFYISDEFSPVYITPKSHLTSKVQRFKRIRHGSVKYILN